MEEQAGGGRMSLNESDRDLIARAKGMASVPHSTTYPSMAAAQHVRDVLASVTARLEAVLVTRPNAEEIMEVWNYVDR